MVSIVYLAYLLISAALVFVLAQILSKHGEAFLEDVFEGNPRLAQAVNKLLVVGFYLFNLGFACSNLPNGRGIQSMHAGIEIFASAFASLLFALAGMHFFNLLVFRMIRRSRSRAVVAPPIAPQIAATF